MLNPPLSDGSAGRSVMVSVLLSILSGSVVGSTDRVLGRRPDKVIDDKPGQNDGVY